MIDLEIGLDGVPSLRKLNLGNNYENNDEMINFILPPEFENYNKYIIAVIKQNGEKITKVEYYDYIGKDNIRALIEDILPFISELTAAFEE